MKSFPVQIAIFALVMVMLLVLNVIELNTPDAWGEPVQHLLAKLSDGVDQLKQ